MSALDLATIPSAINTYERLLLWSAQCCQSIANGEQVQVVSGQSVQPIANVQISVTADMTERAVVVVYLPIDFDELNSATEKSWMAAMDINTAAPHVNLLSN